MRVVRLPENSGGCSRPRNVGLEHARAPYVMFLDSDDVYDRHACKNLLLTAERTGADLVAGQVVRLHLDQQKETGWIKRLYTRRAVYEGIRDNPDLFFDPLSTNKLYRRDFLDSNHIRFPEGVHYEDSLFSTKAYVHAKRIAMVPNVIYYWRVTQEAEDLSITQRRFEINNFRDRIAVHRMIDEFLHEQGADDLKVWKDYKFVRNDLRLYLSDLPHRDESYQRAMLEMAADYLATVSDETLALCDPVERVCVHMIRRLDLDETLRTVDYLRFGFKLSTRLVERDGRLYWTDKYLDDPPSRAVLDVTSMGWHRLPWDRLSLYNSLSTVQIDRGRLLLAGQRPQPAGPHPAGRRPHAGRRGPQPGPDGAAAHAGAGVAARGRPDHVRRRGRPLARRRGAGPDRRRVGPQARDRLGRTHRVAALQRRPGAGADRPGAGPQPPRRPRHGPPGGVRHDPAEPGVQAGAGRRSRPGGGPAELGGAARPQGGAVADQQGVDRAGRQGAGLPAVPAAAGGPGAGGVRVAHGPAVLRQPALHLRGRGRGRSRPARADPGLVARQEAAGRLPGGRPDGAARELALLLPDGPGAVLGRQPGLPAGVHPSPRDDVHPDLARHPAQADGLRLARARARLGRDPQGAQGADAALERACSCRASTSSRRSCSPTATAASCCGTACRATTCWCAASTPSGSRRRSASSTCRPTGGWCSTARPSATGPAGCSASTTCRST